MTTRQPETELDPRYGDHGVGPIPWPDAERQVADAELYWLTTVRPDGRPHVTPLVGVWLDGAFHFCTGGHERKARNLAGNPNAAVTTGRNTWAEGVDIVLEGVAVRVVVDTALHRIADAYRAKYGDAWDFQVRGDEFVQGDDAGGHVFRVAPTTAFAFGKGPFSQTRYTF